MSVRSLLKRTLPPPRYMTLPSVGVDISDTSLKFIQFSRNIHGDQDLVLQQWGDIDIPAGALQRGIVEDPAALTKAIADVRQATNAEFVRVSLPEERAYLFETTIKRGTPEKEIRGILEFRLEENVPLSPREAFFDYDIIDDAHESNELRVSVAAYARDTIMNYYEACRGAQVTPLSFEIEAQAIARATIPASDTHSHIIVDFGKTRTGIGIVYRGALMYTSTIDIGGRHLSNVMRRVLGDDVDESELTRIKNKEGLIPGADDARVYESLISTVSAIKDEIATRIAYWDEQNRSQEGRAVTSVILCGGSCNLKGLPGYLTDTLNVPTYRADVWQNAFDIEATVPPIGRRFSFGYATAIGLGLNAFLE